MKTPESALFGLSNRFLAGNRARIPILLVLDSAIVASSVLLAFAMRYQGQSAGPFLTGVLLVVGLALAIKLPVFFRLGIYRISQSHLSVRDMIRIFEAACIGSGLLAVASLLLQALGAGAVDPSVLAADYLLSLFLLGGTRSAKRVYSHIRKPPLAASAGRVLIAGAGSAGDLTIRAIQQDHSHARTPVGIVDDDPAKQGMTIQGVPVLGILNDIPRLCKALAIGELLIAMPSASPALLKQIVELGRTAGLKRIRVLPAFQEVIAGNVNVADIRDVRLEDLLGREVVQIDTREIERYLTGKTVLVTGGAGSIGSELCWRIATFQPKTLVVLDQDETGLFDLRRRLNPRFPVLDLVTTVGNIRDEERTREVFSRFRPQVVFHAAAYKHVSMMEENPSEAVATNVFGTRVLAQAACSFGADKFVLISTDKAVNPSCVMGATKRLAEMVVRNLNQASSCKFTAVRFGNVLGSRGSVVPIFQEQIEHGGPVTVTHPEMRRYFMAPSEAALLVLQAGAIADGGEVFVLDMGEPVAILTLAREMIRLAGLRPDLDIPIVFTDPYPGEKLFEDILTAEEGTVASKHSRIYVAKTNGFKAGDGLNARLDRLGALVGTSDRDVVIGALAQLVPTYRRGNGHNGRVQGGDARWLSNDTATKTVADKPLTATRSKD